MRRDGSLGISQSISKVIVAVILSSTIFLPHAMKERRRGWYGLLRTWILVRQLMWVYWCWVYSAVHIMKHCALAFYVKVRRVIGTK